ncbi:MAG: DMT family transporter [Euzebyales bacterium]|jgi:drug/metabolite transporter (DMT)-like permease|nr:DMT family transporter [Euzebyales bacterium]
MGATPTQRRRLLETGAGTRLDAFGSAEWGLLAAVALIWGSSFLFMDIGLESLRPGVVTMARVGLGAAALGLVPRARAAVAREDMPRVAFLGLIWIAVPLMLFPIAQQWIDSSVAGMLNGAVPLTTAAWSVALLRRAPGRTQLLGIAVGFAGVVAISWPELQGSRSTALGAALVVLAVALYGLSANLAVPLQQRYGALPVLLRAQLAALLIVVPFGLASLPGSRWTWDAAVAMIPLGVLGTGLAFVLMFTLVGRVGGPRGSVAIYFVPVVAIILGVVFLSEEIAPLAAFGTALVLAGAWLTSRREAPPPLSAPAVGD